MSSQTARLVTIFGSIAAGILSAIFVTDVTQKVALCGLCGTVAAWAMRSPFDGKGEEPKA